MKKQLIYTGKELSHTDPEYNEAMKEIIEKYDLESDTEKFKLERKMLSKLSFWPKGSLLFKSFNEK